MSDPPSESRFARLGDWLDERLGLRAGWRKHFSDYRLPARSNRPFALGGLLVFIFGLQLATGILLLFYYVPDPEHAFESVRHIMREVPYGWLIRLLHAHGANLMVLVLFVHLFRVAYLGAYKSPRELTWITGCALFLLILGSALTGYMLPWSQVSYWATTVVTASLEYLPVVGHDLVLLARGGEMVGPVTFRRAFAAHVGLIPLVLMGLIALHLYLVRRHDIAPPPLRAAEPPREEATRPFFPDFALTYALTIVGFLLVLFTLILFAPNLFFPVDHFLPANPFETPPNVKPEWYFLWAYQLPRLIPEALALPLQGLAVLALFALPFLDRSPHRHPLDRPLITAGLTLAWMALVALSILGYLA